MMSLPELFCHVDDFCQHVEPEWKQQLSDSSAHHDQACQLSTSKIMTILIHFHQNNTEASKPTTCSMFKSTCAVSFRNWYVCSLRPAHAASVSSSVCLLARTLHNALIFNMLMETDLKLMTPIGSDRAALERKLVDNEIIKLKRMQLVDNSRRKHHVGGKLQPLTAARC